MCCQALLGSVIFSCWRITSPYLFFSSLLLVYLLCIHSSRAFPPFEQYYMSSLGPTRATLHRADVYCCILPRNDKNLDTKINGKVASHNFSESVLGSGMGMPGAGTCHGPIQNFFGNPQQRCRIFCASCWTIVIWTIESYYADRGSRISVHISFARETLLQDRCDCSCPHIETGK